MFKLASLIGGLVLAGTLSAQVEPHAGQWKTWVIPSGTAMRLPAPPDAVDTAAELQWVKSSAGARNQADLTQIRFWDAGAPGYRWMQLTEQLAISKGLAAPLQTRALALVAAAIYDATIAAWDSKYTYNRQHPVEIDSSISTAVTASGSPSYPSEHAATAAAAAAVLVSLFPDQTAAINEMADQAGWSRILAGVAFPSDVTGGMDLGHLVGQAVAAYAVADGSGQVFTGTFAASPGVWSSATPVAPLAGTWHPWVLTAGNQFRPAAPPAFGSSDANAQYAADKNLQRTNATNHSAWFWQPGFFQPWLQQVETEIFQNHQDGNAPRAARAYALETIAQHDATLACWDAKYTYLELRPPQADDTIAPLFALPQHPGYPSGHACASGASAAVLSYLYPADAQALQSMAADAGNSTFDALIHTQLDVSTGLTLGGQVGQQVVARAQKDGAN
uniref:Phosphoesterase, PA-phosphatase related n=1 Tax=Solibacter usitatus (strain Ellin6076) TaxID=234267 RepID=Q01W83_SOLUE